MTNHRVQVFNASAGSGKTFQIATNYLNKIIQAQENTYIYRLIGITFTNKAASEMKERILNNLINASNGKIDDVMEKVVEESKEIIYRQTKINNEKEYHQEIIKRSKHRLLEILHNYDNFQLTTIDKTMYRIIKTFARDMNLPANVEVIMDYKTIISNLIDKLIAQAKKGNELTNFFIDFAKNKTDENKTWDIKNDLVNIDSIIFDDNYFNEIKSLENKTFSDFINLKKIINQQLLKIKNSIKETALLLQKEINEYSEILISGEIKFIKSALIPNNLIKNGISDANRKNTLIKKNVYKKTSIKKLSSTEQSYIENEFNDKICDLKSEIIKNFDTYQFYKLLLKEINVLSILKALFEEIEQYKIDNHSIFINDFNKLILEQILKDLEADTPYIYMRLGEKYSQYFVDEFQDTSELQWQNLVPLIREALSKEYNNNKKGEVTIVGDAKQSIYRFRGGKPEQFMAVSNINNQTISGNPFYNITSKKVANLPYNWRSLSNIINFNNHFFSFFPDYLENEDYKNVYTYKNVKQKVPKKRAENEGYIQIQFLEKAINTEDKPHAIAVLETIEKAVENGYKKEEICILINRYSHGYPISDTLIRNGIDVVSSETLLIKKATKVQFLIAWIQFLESGNETYLYTIVHFLTEKDGIDKNQSYFLILKKLKEIENSKQHRINLFKELNYLIDYQKLTELNLYDSMVYLIDVFQLNSDNFEQAYLQAFMEDIHRFNSQNSSNFRDYLQHWEVISEKFSIKVSERPNAVNMMTVHKSKGLEFPVVIYYAEGKLVSNKDEQNKVWIPFDEKEYGGFNQLPIELKALKNTTNQTYKEIYQTIIEEKKFDNLNRLYVALTRASEQLYIITEPLPKSSSTIGFNHIFDNYVQKNTNLQKKENKYFFGKPERIKIPTKKTEELVLINQLHFSNWQKENKEKSILKISTQSFERWSKNKKESIIYGMLVHDILSKITTYQQWKEQKNKLMSGVDSELKLQVINQIESLLTHPKLAKYYSNDYQILNERELLIPNNSHQFIQKRPDRLVVKNKLISIIDYKTGKQEKHHQKQVNEYAELLKNIGYKIQDKILIYIKNEIDVVIY